MTPKKSPDVFSYQSILSFLQDTYKFRKRAQAGFSYETWAQEMGLRSRSYLRAVITGHKPMQESLIAPLLKSFKFTSDEAHYFNLLCQTTTAPTDELRALYQRDLFQIWKRKISETKVEDVQQFLADSLNPVLFTYISFEDTASDFVTIAGDLGVSVEKVQNAMRALIWSHLVNGDLDDDGKVIYRTIKPFFSVPSHQGSTDLKRFHIDGIENSLQAARGPSEKRKLYATFFALDENQFTQVQKLIEEFNAKLLALTESESLHAKRIFRLNQQLIAVSEIAASQKTHQDARESAAHITP